MKHTNHSMPDAVFRSAPDVQDTPEVQEAAPETELPKDRALSGESDREPIEIREEKGQSVVLDALNISDPIDVLPEEDKSKVADVKQYVLDVMESRGLGATVASFKKVLDEVKEEMGLDREAEPSIVLDRISGVVRAWKNLSFIKDPSEKKSIFMKLANMKSSADMNREVYRLMNQYKIWR